MRESPSGALFSKNSLLNSLLAGNLRWRLVRSRLHPPPRSPMRTVVSRSLTNSPQFAGISAGSNADVRSLSQAEVAIASILVAGLWALQTRSWRARPELHMKIARFKSTNRASRIGGGTPQEQHPGEGTPCPQARLP